MLTTNKKKGAGESGKSTISKQMKIIHLSGFNEDERKSYIEIICSNIITSMKALVSAAEKLDIETEEKNKVKFEYRNLS